MENQLPNDHQLSKRERRHLRREALRQALESGIRPGRNKRLAFWFGGAAVIVGIVVGLIFLASRPRTAAPVEVLADPVTANEWLEGNPQATTTLVEYSDFQCQACGFYYPLVKKLSQDFKNDLRIVYRHFPLRLTHQNAEASAIAAEAAGAQAKFWAMHDKLFENQKIWSEQLDPTPSFNSYAQALGLNLEKFKADLNSKAIKDKIEKDFQSGVRSGVDSTPTFFLNGRKIINPPSYDEFAQLIRASFATAAATP